MRLLIKLPSRERVEKFFAALDNITNNIRTDNYEILASLDIDDGVMTTEGVKAALQQYPKVTAVWGTSKTKVEAVNADIWMIKGWAIIIVVSDDMFFTKKHFDDNIFKAADGFSGLIHFPDGHANERLCTLPIMTKDYYDLFGYIYHPDFKSVYCDNFQQDVAIKLGKYKFVNENIVQHQNPIWGYGQPDALFRRNENPANYKIDEETYHRLQEEYAV